MVWNTAPCLGQQLKSPKFTGSRTSFGDTVNDAGDLLGETAPAKTERFGEEEINRVVVSREQSQVPLGRLKVTSDNTTCQNNVREEETV